MAYTIFKTDNSELTVVEDGTIDNSTDLKLIGKNYSGYGEIQNENFVYLLENFASRNQPPRPIAGQLWFNVDSNKIEIYDGNDENVFVSLGNLHIGPKPSGAAITTNNVNKGDMWWDDVTNQLYAHSGSTTGDPFVLIGPKAAQNVLTDVVEQTVFDNLLVDGDPTPNDHAHKILRGYVNDTTVFIVSNDEFTLDNGSAISGFDRIKKGITLVNTENSNNGVTQDNYNFWGNASNALRLGGVLAEEFVERSNPVFITQVDINDNDGINIGPNDEVRLRVANGEAELLSTINGGKLHFSVQDLQGTTINPATVTTTGFNPTLDNTFDLGTSSLRWNEIHATNFKGITDKANLVLSDGTYKSATKSNTNDTLVTRDSVGDIYGTAFRGTGLFNSSDAAAAVTARVTRADSLRVDGTTDYVNASASATAGTVALRDTNGNLTANTFSGLATTAVRLQVPTGVPNQFEYRAASVASTGAAEPNTVGVRDATGRLHASEFVGPLNGIATSADVLTTPRTITFTGDASGSAVFDGSSDVNINLSTVNNAVQLGEDTAGIYVASVATRSGIEGQYLNVYTNNDQEGTPVESAVITLGLDIATSNDANKIVGRDQFGSFAAEDITADGKFYGQVNEAGTTKDGYFANLYCDNFSFANEGTLGISGGGTGATTAPNARTNLGVYSTGEVDSLISGLNSAISGISSDQIVSGTTNATVATGVMNVTINGALHSRFDADGITLSSGNFVGTATSATFADLAEKYSTAEEYPVGTVVEVSTDEDTEMALATATGVVAGVISDKPAYLMNAEAEGQAVALKGRVPVRIYGPVKKGEAVYVYQDGLASVDGEGDLVGVALHSDESNDGEKLVEVFLKV